MVSIGIGNELIVLQWELQIETANWKTGNCEVRTGNWGIVNWELKTGTENWKYELELKLGTAKLKTEK